MKKKILIAVLLVALPHFAQIDTQWALRAIYSHLSHDPSQCIKLTGSVMRRKAKVFATLANVIS